MSGNSTEYNRKYAKEHRATILRKRKERYWTDPMYRETMVKRTSTRRILQRVDRPRLPISSLDKEVSRLIIIGEKEFKVYNKAAFARVLGVTRPTIDNWHRWGVLPIPKDVDALGRFWYREEYINIVDECLGKYKLKLRKEVLAERFKGAFSC
ncbi:MAG: hypothetical protein HQK96_01485 [Nitrospirae bacterium]|nr:hypothetical protein [Nitrospirota bacterium]